MIPEFCIECGAGLGLFRREGEGTCPHCDPVIPKDILFDLVREDGRLELHCVHGIGHTVGYRGPKKPDDDYMYIHGCDGCCRNYKTMERT